MNWFSHWVDRLALLLGRLNVPEETRPLVALALLYLLAVAAAVTLILLLLRRKRRRGAQAVPGALPGEGEGPSGPPAEITPAEGFRRGLAKTRSSMAERLGALLGVGRGVDAELLEELEEVLVTSDIGLKTTRELIASLETRLGRSELKDPAAVRSALAEELISRLGEAPPPLAPASEGPLVVMVVGVNGVGKTTTIGKLAHQWATQGRRVVLGAGDTFRAAAAEQLAIWAERAGAELVRHADGADPAAVAFDAARAAKARGADLLILDTAGRLHTKANLMEELKKIRRVLEREIPGAPHETLLVLDATTGQNALTQARLFREAVSVTGIALTKLDGTAKGGIAVALRGELGLPVRYVGIGEGVSDLRPFDPELFVDALLPSD